MQLAGSAASQEDPENSRDFLQELTINVFLVFYSTEELRAGPRVSWKTDKGTRSVSGQASGHQHHVLKVTGKTPSPTSGPALWYSPRSLYFLLVRVWYLCCSFSLRDAVHLYSRVTGSSAAEGFISPLQTAKGVSKGGCARGPAGSSGAVGK